MVFKRLCLKCLYWIFTTTKRKIVGFIHWSLDHVWPATALAGPASSPGSIDKVLRIFSDYELRTKICTSKRARTLVFVWCACKKYFETCVRCDRTFAHLSTLLVVKLSKTVILLFWYSLSIVKIFSEIKRLLAISWICQPPGRVKTTSFSYKMNSS